MEDELTTLEPSEYAAPKNIAPMRGAAGDFRAIAFKKDQGIVTIVPILGIGNIGDIGDKLNTCKQNECVTYQIGSTSKDAIRFLNFFFSTKYDWVQERLDYLKGIDWEEEDKNNILNLVEGIQKDIREGKETDVNNFLNSIVTEEANTALGSEERKKKMQELVKREMDRRRLAQIQMGGTGSDDESDDDDNFPIPNIDTLAKNVQKAKDDDDGFPLNKPLGTMGDNEISAERKRIERLLEENERVIGPIRDARSKQIEDRLKEQVENNNNYNKGGKKKKSLRRNGVTRRRNRKTSKASR